MNITSRSRSESGSVSAAESGTIEVAGKLGIDVARAGRDPPDRVEEIRLGCMFCDEARCARVQRLADRAWIRLHREHDHARLGSDGSQLGQRLESALSRHDDVEEDHVGLQRTRPAHGLVGVRGLPDHVEIPFSLEHRADAGPQDRVVVDDEHPDHGTRKQKVEGASSHSSPPRWRRASRQSARASPAPPNLPE